MKTPEQIRDMEFQSSAMGGYKKNDVDLFLEEMASEIEILMKQKLEADRKLQEMSKKAPEAALSSAGIQNVLISAQRVAEQLTDDARHQAETIVADANLKLTEAGMKAQEIMAEAEKNASLLGRTAENEATKIIAEAVKKAEEIVSATKESVELQQKLYDRMKLEIADFKTKAVAQCGAILELMSQLPDEIPFNIERAKTVLSMDFSDPAALLNSAVEERLAVEKEEVEQQQEQEAPAAEELKAVEPVVQENEPEAAAEQEVISVSAPVLEEQAETAQETKDEYQLSFDDSESDDTVEFVSTAQPVEEETPVKKGKISFGDDDDDDDDDDEYDGFLFRKKK